MRLQHMCFPKGVFVTLGAQGKVNADDGTGSGPENLGFRGTLPWSHNPEVSSDEFCGIDTC